MRTLAFSLAVLAFGADVRAEEPKPIGTHAPEYALWLGARLGMIGFGNSFYGGPRGDTTGNLVQAGGTLEIDAGARLGKRHVPYLFYEEGLIIPGRKLEGTGTLVTTRFFGLGFRYTALDPDGIGFLADISLGWRTIVMAGNTTYELSGFETFRLGLGAELRLGTRVVISPLAYVSGGVISTNGGTVTFRDGSSPPFTNGASITDQRGYLVLGIGTGVHFDLIGR